MSTGTDYATRDAILTSGLPAIQRHLLLTIWSRGDYLLGKGQWTKRMTEDTGLHKRTLERNLLGMIEQDVVRRTEGQRGPSLRVVAEKCPVCSVPDRSVVRHLGTAESRTECSGQVRQSVASDRAERRTGSGAAPHGLRQIVASGAQEHAAESRTSTLTQVESAEADAAIKNHQKATGQGHTQTTTTVAVACDSDLSRSGGQGVGAKDGRDRTLDQVQNTTTLLDFDDLRSAGLLTVAGKSTEDVKPQPKVKPNGYAGPCLVCRERVGAGEGTLEVGPGDKWKPVHLPGQCPADLRKREAQEAIAKQEAQEAERRRWDSLTPAQRHAEDPERATQEAVRAARLVEMRKRVQGAVVQ